MTVFVVPAQASHVKRDVATVMRGLRQQHALLPGAGKARTAAATVGEADAKRISSTFDHRGHRYRKDQYVIQRRMGFLVVDQTGPVEGFPEQTFNRSLASVRGTQ